MKQRIHLLPDSRSSSVRGFTLVELIVAISIMGIIMVMAVPNFVAWRKNTEYRDAARSVVSMLREARGKAITENRQYRVEFNNGGTDSNGKTPASRFGLRRGNQPFGTNWGDLASNPAIAANAYVTLISYITITPVCNVEYNPNGTSSAATQLLIRDSTPATKFTIDIAATGKIGVTP